MSKRQNTQSQRWGHTLETDECEHLLPFLLCSFLEEIFIGSKKGNRQLVKREKGEARIIFKTES